MGPHDLLVGFADTSVAVGLGPGPVRSAAEAMFRHLGPAGPHSELVVRFAVEEREEGYVIVRPASFGRRHGFPAEASDVREALRLLKAHVLQAFVDRHPDRLWLHAGAASKGDRAVLVAGAWGSGKSTLVAGLCAGGWRYLSDDVVPLRLPEPAQPGVALADPFPLGLAARESAGGPVAPAAVSALPKRHVILPEDAIAAASVRVAAVVLPRYDAGCEAAEAARVSPGEATLALLRSLFDFDVHGAEAVRLLGGLLAEVPAYLLRYSDGAAGAALAARLLDEAAESGGGAAASLADVGDVERVDEWLGVMHEAAGPHPRPAPVEPEEEPANARAEWAPWAWPIEGRRLTVGMATYDDYDGVYFTLQALRLYHPEVADEVEFVVVDNHPDGPCGEALRRLCGPHTRCRYVPNRSWNSTASRDLLFREARTPFVLCLDSHVLLAPGALRRLIDHFEADPETHDLLQGPLVNDDGSLSSHFEPEWSGGMWGVWGTDARAGDPDGVPFDIPMQGLGLFACRRSAWVGFNPRFWGFGGEEGYLHEKVRQHGGRTLCAPWLRWVHRFERPFGVRYRLAWEDRIHNYLLGFRELGLEEAPVRAHFAKVLGEEPAAQAWAAAEEALAHPLNYFDAIYVLPGSMDDTADLPAPLMPLRHRLRSLPSAAPAAAAGVRRLLDLRSALVEAERHALESVAVLDPAAPLGPPEALARQLGGAGEHAPVLAFPAAAGVGGDGASAQAAEPAGVGVHRRALSQLVADLPSSVVAAERWVEEHGSFGCYLTRNALRLGSSARVDRPWPCGEQAR